MSISALTSNPLSQLLATNLNTFRGTNPAAQRPDSSLMPTDSASGVSPFAQMYSKLESLAASDPDKFKAVTSKIAGQLKEAAGKSTGIVGEFLNSLAARFDKASQSGSPSDLQPPEAIGAAANAHGRHHRHYHNPAGPADPASLFGASSSVAASQGQTNLQDLFQTIFNEV